MHALDDTFGVIGQLIFPHGRLCLHEEDLGRTETAGGLRKVIVQSPEWSGTDDEKAKCRHALRISNDASALRPGSHPAVTKSEKSMLRIKGVSHQHHYFIYTI